MPKFITTGEEFYVSKCEYCDNTFKASSKKTLQSRERLHYKAIHKGKPIILINPCEFLAEKIETYQQANLSSDAIKERFSKDYLYRE